MIKVGDLLPQNEVFEQRRSPQPRFEGVLIVSNGNALVCGEHLPGGIGPNAIQSPSHRDSLQGRRTGLLRYVLFTERSGARSRRWHLQTRSFSSRQCIVIPYSPALFHCGHIGSQRVLVSSVSSHAVFGGARGDLDRSRWSPHRWGSKAQHQEQRTYEWSWKVSMVFFFTGIPFVTGANIVGAICACRRLPL